MAAGVVAALRSKPGAQKRSPADVKAALLAHVRQPAGTATGWNRETGFGIVDAKATANVL